MKKQNHILSFCSKLSPNALYRFINSLNETSFNETLVLFIDESDIDNIKKFKNTNFKIEAVVVKTSYHPITIRFEKYLDYLKQRKEKINDIFICDSRDFLFQRNVFEFNFDTLKRYPNEPKKDIYFTMECGFLGECQINKEWIEKFIELYELDLSFDDFKNKKVSCAGAIYGNYHGIISYLNVVSTIISQKDSIKNGTFFLDQAIHNYVLYFNKLSNCNIGCLDNKDGLVNHVSWGRARKTSFISNSGEIANQNGEVAYSVHLYDRNEDFLNKMKESTKWSKYPLEIKQ